jgi:hypothetical protein
MAIAAETGRLMLNWSRWKLGVPISVAVSGAYDLEARGRREETPTPLLNGEALDVDKAVMDLPGDLFHVVEQFWLKKGTLDQKARKCKCAPATFYRRLQDAHGRIHMHMDSLRARGQRMAAQESARMRPLCTACGRYHWLREPCLATTADSVPVVKPL